MARNMRSVWACDQAKMSRMVVSFLSFRLVAIELLNEMHELGGHVDRMSARMSNSMSLVYLVVLVINTYVLLFSNIPFLYRIMIIVFSFALLLLTSLALQGLERIEPPRA